MREVDLVVVVSEIKAEGQCEEGGGRRERALLAWVVLDVQASAVPPDLPRFGLLLAVYKRFHAVVVETVRLYQVHDVEFVEGSLASVANSEVKPLAQLLRRPVVELQLQFILEFAYLRCAVKVPALEARLKNQRRVIRSLQIVVLVEAIVVASIECLSVLSRGKRTSVCRTQLCQRSRAGTTSKGAVIHDSCIEI